MSDRTNTTSTEAGVLRPEQLAEHALLRRYPCDGPLGRWVENFWSLEWDLPDGTSYDSQTLPHPACHLSVERGHTRRRVEAPVVVTGVVTRRFDVTLSGRGRVVAAKFRPGGLAAFTGHPVRSLRDTVAPAGTVLAPSVVDRLVRLDTTVPLDECVRRAGDALSAVAPGDDPRFDCVLRVVADALGDRSVLRVAQLEEHHGLSSRALQRLFDRYVGVGPKWVLARYRMHDAVSDLDGGYQGSIADLAVSLGWYDQAHFTRDFVALVGVTPGRYRSARKPGA